MGERPSWRDRGTVVMRSDKNSPGAPPRLPHVVATCHARITAALPTDQSVRNAKRAWRAAILYYPPEDAALPTNSSQIRLHPGSEARIQAANSHERMRIQRQTVELAKRAASIAIRLQGA